MPGRQAHSVERIRRGLSLVPPIVTLSVGVVLPVLLSTAAGIVAIVLGESSATLIIGILVVSFTAAAIGGAVILFVLLGRRARLARLQADLLANVTHELRTPLAAIRLHAQTLESGLLRDDPARAAESLRTIVRETEWLDAMVDRVLSWRAAARDRPAPGAACAPLRPAVEEAAARFLRMVPEDEVVLSSDWASDTPARHDPDAIEQAVLNLLVNAYKFTAAPQRRIVLGLRDRGAWVAVSVEDNGIGIPSAEVRRIFEPFHRVSNPSRRTAGAGLGLAIVHHVVRSFGGRIAVDTREGEGSRFTILLPRCSPSEGAR